MRRTNRMDWAIALVHSQMQKGIQMNDLESLPYILMMFLGLIFGSMIGWAAGDNHKQQEAVLKGHAEWVADTNGKAEFKWKEIKP